MLQDSLTGSYLNISYFISSFILITLVFPRTKLCDRIIYSFIFFIITITIFLLTLNNFKNGVTRNNVVFLSQFFVLSSIIVLIIEQRTLKRTKLYLSEVIKIIWQNKHLFLILSFFSLDILVNIYSIYTSSFGT